MSDFQRPDEWINPPAEFSFAPFWFWNDELHESEIARQLDEFQAHGVDAFVIHPRVGLPRYMGWMSRALLDRMHFAIQQAQSRGMWVILYDEGMYPSGSSSGQVVAENPAYHCRGMVRINLDEAQPNTTVYGVRIDADGQPELLPDQNLVAIVPYRGQRFAIVDRPADAVIRGLHFIHEGTTEPPEDTPPATDLLNPDAVACFIRLVYDRFYAEFGGYFGNTIQAIFTDEPNLLGRVNEPDILPGTTGIMQYVNDYLGYDFTPHLPALWDEDAPDDYRREYERALEHRFQEIYYQPLYDWCEAHHIALTGHPAEPDATVHMRYFQMPGQDIVWRYMEPDKPSALEGRQSTQAKAASSVMLHEGRRRNANEFCGAYGMELSFEEVQWLANWLLIRGCNLLIPHAFYYSIRGPRQFERPPDVGINSPWWGTGFTDFARASRRLCWLNTDSQHICHAAILGEHHHLPWRAAKVCFENQIDFNYVDNHDLQKADISAKGIRIAGQFYEVLIVDEVIPPGIDSALNTLENAGRLLHWSDDSTESLAKLRQMIPEDVILETPAPGLRVRHVQKAGLDWYMLFNERSTPLDTVIRVNASGSAVLLNPASNEVESFDAAGRLQLVGHAVRVLAVR